MVSPVSSVDLCRILRIHPCKNSSCYHQPAGDPGRDIICHIIQFGCNTAKIQVFIIFVPQHGIHGIDAFVQKHQRHTTNGHIKHGRDNTIRSIFRNCFHCCFCHTGFRKLFGITANDHGNRITCLIQCPVFQAVINFHTFVFQRTGGKQLIAPEYLQHKTCHRQKTIKIIKDQKWHSTTEQTDKNYGHKASCQLSSMTFRKNLPNGFLQYRDQISDNTDRMVQPSGIPDKKIQHKSKDQCQKTIFQHLFSASVLFYIPAHF